jgi:2-polyprenyl-6-methoxyphenol hydroxylase-like FAD-dependent oxidoreductase
MQSTDGTSEAADAVISCDGANSRIVQISLKRREDVEPRLTGKHAYRGLILMKRGREGY